MASGLDTLRQVFSFCFLKFTLANCHCSSQAAGAGNNMQVGIYLQVGSYCVKIIAKRVHELVNVEKYSYLGASLHTGALGQLLGW